MIDGNPSTLGIKPCAVAEEPLSPQHKQAILHINQALAAIKKQVSA
jgi:hypothetical protein